MAEGTIKIKEMEELTELTDNDYFVVDNLQSGVPTKKYKATRVIQMIENVADEIEEKITPSIDTALAVGSASGNIASFSDGSNLPMPKLQVGIEPVQDLHGYDHPWVGGGGKNKLQVAATTQTVGGITFTINNNGTINVNGTATQNITLELSRKSKNGTPLPQGDLILNGCPSGGSTSSYYLTCWRTNSGNANDVGEGRQFSYQSDWDFVVSLVILSGTTCNNLTFKPMIRLATETDATFAPYSNICPISGWTACNVVRCGKNQFDKSTIVENKIINNNTGEEIVSYGRFSSDYIKVKSSTDYYATDVIKSAQWYCVFYYDKNKNYLSCAELSSTGDTASGVVTTPSNCVYVRLVGITTYKDSTSFVEGNQSTTYSAYSGNTYTIDLDGTRYGATLDVVSGKLVVDRASIKLNDLNWIKQNTTSGNWRFISSQSIQNIKLPTDASWKIDNLCSVYQNVTANETWIAEKTGIAINADGKLLICDLNQADITALGVVIANQTYCYELATPITYQLTPTQVKSLLGSNNVWADTGEIIDCEYKRDATAIINSLIARIEALENQ